MPEEVQDEQMRVLLIRLYNDWKAGHEAEPDVILDYFDDAQVRDFVSKCLMNDEETDADKQLEIDLKVAKDCLRSLEIGKLKMADHTAERANEERSLG